MNGRMWARPVWAGVAVRLDDGSARSSAARDATIHRPARIEPARQAIEP